MRLATVLMVLLNVGWILCLGVGLSLYLDDDLETDAAKVLTASAIYTAGNVLCIALLCLAIRRNARQPDRRRDEPVSTMY